jgi:signal transduction histidine kinase
VAKDWLSQHVWPLLFGDIRDDGFDVTLLDTSRGVLYTTESANSRAKQSSSLMATRDAEATSVPWRIRVSPHDPAALTADLTRRPTMYLAMLVLVLMLLGCGTYLTTRVVRKELEVARLQSDFVATVSHEFRSPLTGIRQLGELLMLGRVPSDARRQEYYERITRESDRLSRLVENLLDFSRMENGRKQYRFEPLDPSPWLRHVVAEAQAQAGDHMTVVADIPDALPPLVADGEALGCAVHNLVDNAIKYSLGRDAVWVEATTADRHVTIRVRDRGVGIPAAERKRIFDKFYRGQDEITRQVKGAGLGLSLVQHIVAAHGGRVECDSQPGEGATFVIHLPAHATNPGR